MPYFKSKINQQGVGAKVIGGDASGNFQATDLSVQAANSFQTAELIPTGDDNTTNFWVGLSARRYFCTAGRLSHQPSDAGFLDILKYDTNTMAILWISVSNETQWIKTVYNGTVSDWRSFGGANGIFPKVVKTTGSSTAYTVSVPEVTSLVSGATIAVQFHTASGAGPTINVSGLGEKPLQVVSGSSLPSGFFPANAVVLLQYVGDRWLALSAGNSWTYDTVAAW